MFSSFKIDTFELDNNYDVYFDEGKNIFLDQAKRIKKSLDNYLLPNGSLDAEKKESDWFPQIDADVFVSHSHNDFKQIIIFAGYLKRLGLRVFVDSCVWWLHDDLLKDIDDEYCVSFVDDNEKFIYDYKTRNKSTAYVHMILNGALMKMIDRTECLLFIDTPNSIKTKELYNITTDSCWIYNELLMSKYFRRVLPKRDLTQSSSSYLNYFIYKKPLVVEYKVDTSHLVPLTLGELENASCNGHKTGLELLDQLYVNKEMARVVNLYGDKNGKED